MQNLKNVEDLAYLTQMLVYLVIYWIFEKLLMIDKNDPRGRNYRQIIDLMHSCFTSFINVAMRFDDATFSFNTEIIDACSAFYHMIQREPLPDLNDACYWLAAIHAIVQEPTDDVENLMLESPQFTENLFGIIGERNRAYLNYVYHAYRSVLNLNDQLLAARLSHFQILRGRFEENQDLAD